MATSEASEIIRHLRKTVLLPDGADLTDGQLLEFFLNRRDEAAMEVLVRRHGPMVWGVCRRVLPNHHDAEDAFQATFLVFVRRAASIASRELLANWLYGVAHQTALKARAMVAKRKGRERQVTEMPEPTVAGQDLWHDLQPLLDQELSRLPDKYRAVIVLCDLEGKTRKEAARQLGLPEGTVGSRLARARTMLAKRLAQRGVVLSGGTLAAVLTQKVASAGVPTSVVLSTIKAAGLLAAGTAATGAISVKVAALMEGVLKAMLFTKLRAAIAAVLILGFVATGATVLACRTAAGQDDKEPAAEKPVKPAAKPEKDKEAFTAWSKEVGGLQAGLGIRPGERRVYHHGETITLVVRVRNVGKETVKFEYVRQFLDENPPTVTDADGKTIPQNALRVEGFHLPLEVSLEPGKETELESRLAGASGLRYELLPASGVAKPTTQAQPLFVGTGKVSVQYERVFGNSSASRVTLDPTLSKLATGKLELEIKPSPAAPPGVVPAPEGPVPPEAPVPVKAVYFVGIQGGDLAADDLKKHPEVKTVHTFADLQCLAGKKVAVWIDLTALPLLRGDKEMEWVIRRNVEGYPFAMVGCNEFLWCFRENLDCFGISGPGPVDWTKYELSPGFSVICQRREKVGVEVHVAQGGRGYKVVPTVEKILNVTNRLLAGEAAPDAP